MAKKRYVSDSFWSDLWIENLDPLERYLYLYLITNPLVSVCWIYEIQPKRIAYETWIEKEMVLKMITRFQNDEKVFYKDWILLIVNFVKNQSITKTDDNLWKWVEREVKCLGEEKLATVLSLEGASRTLQGAYKGVPIPYLTLLNLTLHNLTKPNGIDDDLNEEENINISTSVDDWFDSFLENNQQEKVDEIIKKKNSKKEKVFNLQSEYLQSIWFDDKTYSECDYFLKACTYIYKKNWLILNDSTKWCSSFIVNKATKNFNQWDLNTKTQEMLDVSWKKDIFELINDCVSWNKANWKYAKNITTIAKLKEAMIDIIPKLTIDPQESIQPKGKFDLYAFVDDIFTKHPFNRDWEPDVNKSWRDKAMEKAYDLGWPWQMTWIADLVWQHRKKANS